MKFLDYIPWKINTFFSFWWPLILLLNRPISMNQNEDGTVYTYRFTHTTFNLVEYNTMFRYVFMALAEFLMKAEGYVRYVSQHWHLVHISAFQHKILVSWGLHVYFVVVVTHWGRVTHICVSELPIIGSDNGLSPGRRQAIIWTNAAILLIRALGTNLNEILSEIHAFSFKKM